MLKARQEKQGPRYSPDGKEGSVFAAMQQSG